jgi:hypothetical protein
MGFLSADRTEDTKVTKDKGSRRTTRSIPSASRFLLCVLGVLRVETAVGVDTAVDPLTGDPEWRPRALTPDVERRLEALRSLQGWLDEAFRVPGTSLRFGWDPLIGLLPYAGDLLTALMSGAIVLQAHHMRLPRVVQLRMLGNVAIDLVAGAIPFLGDAADFFWKSNKKNFAMLEQHAYEVRPPSAGDWLFVTVVLLAIAAVALVPLAVMYWIGSMLFGRA